MKKSLFSATLQLLYSTLTSIWHVKLIALGDVTKLHVYVAQEVYTPGAHKQLHRIFLLVLKRLPCNGMSISLSVSQSPSLPPSSILSILHPSRLFSRDDMIFSLNGGERYASFSRTHSSQDKSGFSESESLEKQSSSSVELFQIQH